MTEQLKSVITLAGLKAINAAQISGIKGKITHLAIGDSDGVSYNASRYQTGLKNEKMRVEIVEASSFDQTFLVGALFEGGNENFIVNEISAILEDGTTFAIWANEGDALAEMFSHQNLLLQQQITITSVDADNIEIVTIESDFFHLNVGMFASLATASLTNILATLNNTHARHVEEGLVL
ncbi:MAG: phage tail protein [Rhizobiales bacterium]|nr:phage tail protein [Hyphomicrobiales bacterium]